MRDSDYLTILLVVASIGVLILLIALGRRARARRRTRIQLAYDEMSYTTRLGVYLSQGVEQRARVMTRVASVAPTALGPDAVGPDAVGTTVGLPAGQAYQVVTAGEHPIIKEPTTFAATVRFVVPPCRPGDPVLVLVDRQHPQRYFVDLPDLGFFADMAALARAIPLGYWFPLGLMIRGIARRAAPRLIRELEDYAVNGVRVAAIVKRIDRRESTSTDSDGHTSTSVDYVVVAEGDHPLTQQRTTFRSDSASRYPPLRVGEPIVVLVSARKPRRFQKGYKVLLPHHLHMTGMWQKGLPSPPLPA